MSMSITLTFRWPMGHRILGLQGPGSKCRNIHGHNWQAEITWPNNDGSLEFGAVKSAVGDYISEFLDHGFAVAADDPFLSYLIDDECKRLVLTGPPTTEQLAHHLGVVAEELTGAMPVRVHLIEGYRNAATWEADS